MRTTILLSVIHNNNKNNYHSTQYYGMSNVINQLKCAIRGHEASQQEVNRLNEVNFVQIEEILQKELDTKCKWCNYPIRLRKYKLRPNRYQIIER